MDATYTHGHEESVLRSHRWRTAENSAGYLLPHLREDLSLLDVGAGPGTITGDLAGRVASATATEVDEDTLALTRQGVEAAVRPGTARVEYVVADVHALPMQAASFDVVHAHQVLQHVADPVQGLREMRRVARPGGLVAVRDSDYPAFAWYPRVPGLDEWLELYLTLARGNGGEPAAGRRLLSWARTAGFEEVTATSSTWCFSTPEDRAWWGGMWADRVRHTKLARQAIATGAATASDLDRIAAAWRSWAAADDGWFSVLHGEILA
ncbi:MAG: class I SAM-dependent methyltransferase, partial [Nocardioides sp.]